MYVAFVSAVLHCSAECKCSVPFGVPYTVANLYELQVTRYPKILGSAKYEDPTASRVASG